MNSNIKPATCNEYNIIVFRAENKQIPLVCLKNPISVMKFNLINVAKYWLRELSNFWNIPRCSEFNSSWFEASMKLYVHLLLKLLNLLQWHTALQCAVSKSVSLQNQVFQRKSLQFTDDFLGKKRGSVFIPTAAFAMCMHQLEKSIYSGFD